MTPTRTLADWCVATASGPLDAAVARHARRGLLDAIGAIVAGSPSQAATIVADYLGAGAATGTSTVLGTGRRLVARDAAVANGTAGHALEVDDGYTPGAFHPGVPVVAAALAVAERDGSSAETLLRAVAIGIEVACRIAEAGHPSTWRRGFHNTSIAAVFGATATAGVLTRLDAATLASAFGVTGSHASGLFAFLGQGVEVKRYHAGMAAGNGLVSADLAARGLSGPANVLESPLGYFAAFADDAEAAARVLDGLGDDWRLARTYHKPYPCCRHLHAPIDAVLALREAHDVDADAVTAIEVETFTGAARHDATDVASLIDAQMSIPFAVAAALRFGPLAVEHFAAPARDDATVRRLTGAVTVRVADDCERDYPAMRPARVTVHLGDEQLTLRVDDPRGEPSNPLSDDELREKFVRLAAPVLGDEAASDACMHAWAARDLPALLAVLAVR